MTIINSTSLLTELERNETRASAIIAMIDSGFSVDNIRNSLEELHESSEAAKQIYATQLVSDQNVFKGSGYYLTVDSDDKSFVILNTGIASINFNRVDYSQGFCALFLDCQIVCSVEIPLTEVKAIEAFLRSNLLGGYKLD